MPYPFTPRFSRASLTAPPPPPPNIDHKKKFAVCCSGRVRLKAAGNAPPTWGAGVPLEGLGRHTATCARPSPPLPTWRRGLAVGLGFGDGGRAHMGLTKG